MKFVFDTDYSKEEMEFLQEHHCEILSEIKLSRVNFSEYEIPRRMFQYGGSYIGEIIDDENGNMVWGVLLKWKGVYRFSAGYPDLQSLEQGL